MDRRTRTPSAQTRYFRRVFEKTTLRLKSEVREMNRERRARNKAEKAAAREMAQ